MSALLDDIAVLHDQDQVRRADRRETMRDHERRTALHKVIHGPLDALLRARVDRARRLIENEHAPVRQDRARNREKADVGRVFVDHEIVAAGQGGNEVVRAARARRSLHLFVGRVELAIADVLANRAAEQPRVLQHHPEHRADVRAREVARIDAADTDSASVDVVEAHEQLHHGRLAGARRTHDGDRLALGDLRREVVDDRLVGRVPEAHMVELPVARDLRGLRLRLLGCDLLLFQEGENALGCGRHLLEHVAHLGQLSDRLREVLHVLDERLDIAHRDGTLHREHAARERHRYVAEVADEVHDRLHEAREELRFPRALVELVVRLLEALLARLFLVERAHDRMAGERLLDLPVDFPELLLLSAKVLLRELHHDHDEHKRDREHDKRDPRHHQVDRDHHRDDADERGDRRDHLRDALVQALP